MALDLLADRIGARFTRHKTNTQLAEGRLGPGLPKLVLVKPQSFMNLSGGPVSSAAKFFGLGADRVIVLHDELDIPFDTVKLKVGGGNGGHNGLRDIIAAQGDGFWRLRIGVGHPGTAKEVVDFVLTHAGKDEQRAIDESLWAGADAIEEALRADAQIAMNKLHARPKADASK